jgi:alanyl-tRNA synthetase
VVDVQKKGPYVLHLGTLQTGKLAVGEELTLAFDEARRRGIMSNHTATHVLNYALRKVCLRVRVQQGGENTLPAPPQVIGDNADQKGSLVEPERLRFDFSHKKAMDLAEVEGERGIDSRSRPRYTLSPAICTRPTPTATQREVRQIVQAAMPVFAKEVSLATAQKIKGLRAMFGETYPDPVRVLSVGADVETVLANPDAPWGIEHSMEFCGGTHVKNSGDIGAFAITSEEAISKVRGVAELIQRQLFSS